ncbi:MAG: diguanylate cyclase [Phycisphaerae bacterium]|nr:diguanylate cyclase [Phycisphaerae bacterium]
MQANPVDVCIIDDDADQRALLFRRLLGAKFSVIEAVDAESGLVQLRHHRPRVVVCDLVLPGMNGTEFCRQVRSDPALDGTYLILVTACNDRETKHQALNAGADDYLVKPFDQEELSARLRNGLRVSKLQERLRHAAVTDGLTNLWNHAQFRELLDREFARTRRYGGVVSLLMLDLDHFKVVNDTYGHETGNLVLTATARHMLHMVRDTDVVSRYGGEEFTVICPATSLDDAAHLAERIRQTIPQHVRVPNCADVSVTASIGVSATTDPRVTSVRDLIDLADQALYLGKRRGRNQVVRCDALDDTPSTPHVERGEVDRLQKQVMSLSMQAKQLCLQSVWALVQALEARDRFTAWHSRNTTYFATALAEAAGLPEPLRVAIANAAMLHDLGKIGVADDILQSATPLSEAESAVLRQVPLITCKILEPLRVFETETLIIRHVRERFDGTGYPFGLAGRTIPVGSRLLAVAETFEALTSERPYRASLTMEHALHVIEAEANKQFDPEMTTLLARVLEAQRDRWRARVQRAQAELRRASAQPKP